MAEYDDRVGKPKGGEAKHKPGGKPDARDYITLYDEARQIRAPYEQDWRMCAAYCLPRHYSAWQTEGPFIHGGNQEVKRFAYDNTGVRSLPKYTSILNRIMTPQNMRWQKLAATNRELMKSHDVRMYFDRLTDELFKRRYAPNARFVQAQGETYASIGVYGCGPKAITWQKPSPMYREGGFAYKAWPLKDVFLLTNDAGQVTHIFRRFYLNARQFRLKFPGEDLPKALESEGIKVIPSEQNSIEFVHILCYRENYDEKSLDYRRHPIRSVYICVRDASYVGEETGFVNMPMVTPRTFTEPGDVYGYSPAQQALPALGGVSAMKKTVLKQGHKAVDPSLLAHDDGAISGRVDQRPGHITWGGIDSQGRRMIAPMETGANFQVAEQLITDERRDIEDSFFVTVFQILSESSEMTATEVVERIAQQAALVEPTMGRLQSEDLGPSSEREIALLAENGILTAKYDLEMPPELREAKGEYEIIYTSPLAKGQHTEDVAGFMRWLEMALKYAEVTQDPSALDWINFDVASPDIADILSVRTAWVRDMESVAAMRDDRQKKAAAQQVMDQAPAIASVANQAMKQGSAGNSQPPGVSNG